MTFQEKRQAVEAAIKKAVPEIMELKFGCRVRKKFLKTDFVYSVREYFQTGTVLRQKRNTLGSVLWVGVLFDSNMRPTDCDKLDLEILGRPITLEDVLRAMPTGGYNAKMWLMNDGTFWLTDDIEWHLGKPLSEQSDEVIEFLHSILCV